MDAPRQSLECNPAQYCAPLPDRRLLVPDLAGMAGGDTDCRRTSVDMGEPASLPGTTVSRPPDLEECPWRGLAQPGCRPGARVSPQGSGHTIRRRRDWPAFCRLGRAILRSLAVPYRGRDGIHGQALVSRPGGLALAGHGACNWRVSELDGSGVKYHGRNIIQDPDTQGRGARLHLDPDHDTGPRGPGKLDPEEQRHPPNGEGFWVFGP